MDALHGRRIGFLVANEGIEQVELTEPWKAVTESGGDAVLIAPDAGKAQAMHHLEMADTFPVDEMTRSANPDDYDALVLPGGVANPDALRRDPSALELVKAVLGTGKPVAAICHAPWVLVEAGVVEGRTLTSYPSLRTDVENAGGTWVDEEVVVDGNLITSRKPDDLPAFIEALEAQFASSEA
jgi:protease I